MSKETQKLLWKLSFFVLGYMSLDMNNDQEKFTSSLFNNSHRTDNTKFENIFKQI